MSKWDLKKVKKQIKFGDFVEFELDGKKVKRIVIGVSEHLLSTIGDGQRGTSEWNNSDLMERSYKFFDRQGNEILPEPEYKYVQCEGALEVCELMIKDEVLYDKRGNRHRGEFTVSYLVINYKEFVKRVEA